MVLSMLNTNHSFLPSPEEILNGIIQAQMDEFAQLDPNLVDFKDHIKKYSEIWEKIIIIGNKNMEEYKKPLSGKVLSDPNN